jgi:hypothetical protein
MDIDDKKKKLYVKDMLRVYDSTNFLGSAIYGILQG